MDPNYSEVELDTITKQFVWDKQYHIDTHSWSCFNDKRGTPRIDSDSNIYTDGSLQTDTDLSGAGMIVYLPKTNRLGEYHILPPFLQSCYILWLARNRIGILLTSKFIAGSYIPKKLKINKL